MNLKTAWLKTYLRYPIDIRRANEYLAGADDVPDWGPRARTIVVDKHTPQLLLSARLRSCCWISNCDSDSLSVECMFSNGDPDTSSYLYSIESCAVRVRATLPHSRRSGSASPMLPVLRQCSPGHGQCER